MIKNSKNEFVLIYLFQSLLYVQQNKNNKIRNNEQVPTRSRTTLIFFLLYIVLQMTELS